MAIDPVCGMEVDENKTEFKLVYQDKTYFFCSNRCLDEFARTPDKYIQKDNV